MPSIWCPPTWLRGLGVASGRGLVVAGGMLLLVWGGLVTNLRGQLGGLRGLASSNAVRHGSEVAEGLHLVLAVGELGRAGDRGQRAEVKGQRTEEGWVRAYPQESSQTSHVSLELEPDMSGW